MQYSHRMGLVVPFASKFKKQLILAVAAVLVATFAITTLSAKAVEAGAWVITPGSQISFSCGAGTYVHTLDTVVNSENGDFTGTGHYNPDNSYTWDIDGNISGDTFDFSIEYTGTASGSVYNASNGSIQPEGSATATVDSNCQSLTMGEGSFVKYEVQEIDVYGNTGMENEKGAWIFNRDLDNATPISFVTDKASLGAGSLFVEPLSNEPAKKFIGEYFARTSIADFESFSYDFLIAGPNGDPGDVGQFYVNFYTTTTDPGGYYNCRFDFVPTIGSTDGFKTFTVDKDDVAANTKNGSVATCPTGKTLGELAGDNYIRAVAITLGDTNASDAGIAGYFDNVVFKTVTSETAYDFEPYPAPTTKDECKNGGWEWGLSYTNQDAFKNQGHCVSHFASGVTSTSNRNKNR